MRRTTVFISAAITAFVLAMLAGVVSAYQGLSNKTHTQQANLQQVALEVALPTQQVTMMIQAQDAATIASNFLKRTDLYSVELADFNGSQTYKVTFSSGDIVYVSMSGQVFGSQPPPPAVVITVKKNGGGGGAPAPAAPAAPSSNNGGGDHNGVDD